MKGSGEPEEESNGNGNSNGLKLIWTLPRRIQTRSKIIYTNLRENVRRRPPLPTALSTSPVLHNIV